MKKRVIVLIILPFIFFLSFVFLTLVNAEETVGPNTCMCPCPCTPVEAGEVTVVQVSTSTVSRELVGKSVNINGLTVEVRTFENPALDITGREAPEGHKYIAIEVVYRNNSSSDKIYVTPLNWTLYDSKFAYRQANVTRDPALPTKWLYSGEETHGWVPFTVKEGDSEYRLIFKPRFWPNDSVEFSLQEDEIS